MRGRKSSNSSEKKEGKGKMIALDTIKKWMKIKYCRGGKNNCMYEKKELKMIMIEQ